MVSANLIQTKISIPPSRVQLVHRERLYRRLDDGSRCRLTLVTAPAGFGKSTLLSGWAGRCDMPLGWYALDAQDNDSDRFLSYLLEALQSAAPRLQLLETAATLRQSRPPATMEVLLTFLANQVEQQGETLGIVLDDYHVIDNQAVDDILAFLLEYLPPHFHIFVASRTEPGFPVARLRASGQMLELTARDLRFTTEEAAQFLHEGMGLQISSEEVAALEARTEGWIAGLQLAGLSLEGRQDAGAFIASLRGTDRYILDYMTEEVFSRLPEMLQGFLLRISIADRFSEGTCDALVEEGQNRIWTGGEEQGEQPAGPRSRAVLEFLDSSNLFVVPLDHKRHWYRFHQLFADFLRDRLEALRPSEIPGLHRKASAWFSSQGFIPEAIHHALLAQEPALAADLIQGQARSMLALGQTGTLRRWIEALPNDLLSSRPGLLLAMAWSQLMSDPAQFRDSSRGIVSSLSDALGASRETIARRLEESGQEAPDGDTLAQYALLLAFLGRDQVPFENTVSLFQAAIAALPQEDLFTRTFGLAGLASTYARQGKLSLAERTFAQSAEISRRLDSPYANLVAKDWEATSQATQGHLTRAASTYRGVIERLSELEADRLPLTGHAFVGLADILRERNELQHALELVNEGLRRGRSITDRDALLDGYLAQARILQALNDETGSRLAIANELQEARMTESQGCINNAEAWEAMLNLSWGDARAAMRWASQRDLLDPGHRVQRETLTSTEKLALARLLAARGEYTQAASVLSELLRMIEEEETARLTLEVQCALAPMLQASGDREGAMRTVAKALLRGEPEGYMRSFLDEGPRMAALLRRAASEGHSPSYVERILRTFGEELSVESAIEPLSQRELDVLRLVGEGLTNSQIAAELVVAQSTVKTHINHIYSKLDVTQRTQAVARARELRLLD